MNDQPDLIVCPSCGKRYQLSDFKDDRLVCSACGREIPRFISVGGVDEEKYVKLYLDRYCNIGVALGLVLFGLLVLEGGGMWLLTLNISFWWKLLSVAMMFGGPIVFPRIFRSHLKIRRIFKANNYRLEDGIHCFKQWYNSLSDDEKSFVPFPPECFTTNLENYVRSHAEIKNNYERTGDGKKADSVLPEEKWQLVIPDGGQGQGEEATYDPAFLRPKAGRWA